MDNDCTAIWMNILKSDEIVGVERMWGFEDTHYGAITLRLKSGLRAMFKVNINISILIIKSINFLFFYNSLVHLNQKIHQKNLLHLILINY